MRERLPDERSGRTHHFTILYANTPTDGAEGTTELDEIDGYLTMNTYPDGRLGEIFIRMSKMGDTISGMTDGFATAFSIALQSGADLRKLCDKLIATRFRPHGPTNDPAIAKCTSILDYVGRVIAAKFLQGEQHADAVRKQRLLAATRELEAAKDGLYDAGVQDLEEIVKRLHSMVKIADMNTQSQADVIPIKKGDVQ